MGKLRDNQEKAFNQAEKTIDNYEKQLLKIYQSSLKEIRNEIMKLDEKITWSLNELKKYDRLKKLEASIDNEAVNLNREIVKTITKTNKDIVKNTYNRSWYGYEKQAQVSLRFNRLNPDLVKNIVTEPYPGVKLSELIKDMNATMLKNLRLQVGIGLSLGESSTQISKRLKNVLGITYKRAVTIARTEGLRASSKAQLGASEQAKDLGIKTTKVWLATLDSRTRSTHRAEDKKKADKNGIFHLNSGASGPAPRMTGVAGEDINCRCTYYEEIEDFPDEITKRRDNESKELIEDLSYDEWLKNKGGA
jgi:hypothetical protein